MAIFRAGKRLGPFDIRGGISRGDLKSSAYSKTDRDPRFKQQANTENTIGRFRAAMASAEGYARPSRYAIRLFPPSILTNAIQTANSTVEREGVKFTPAYDFDEPTRGIDVAAKAQIWKLISEFTKEGCSVIVASNEIPELINNCNRIITMQKGSISNTFNYEDFDEQKISLNISSK